MNARVAAALLALCACSPCPRGVTGNWSARVTTPRGDVRDLVFHLEGSGDTLTGSVAGVEPESALVIRNGTVQGDDVSFQVQTRGPEGGLATFTFSARLSGNSMKGTVARGEPGQSIAFTATRTGGSGPASGGAGERRHVTRRSGGPEPPNPQGATPMPENAEQGILAAFDSHEVVGMGILSYASQDFDQFILDLIRAPAFPTKVNDIVVECGNSLYQAVLDRYIAGDSVPIADVRQVWRNTTQPFCGVATFYEELFPLVRRINQKLPPERRLRVLAGDPPVDWSRVRTRADLRPIEDRDANIAAVMEREVLAKRRKALMIFGVLHLMHGEGNAVGRYESAGYPNRTFVVMAHNGFGTGTPLGRFDDALEQRLAGWPVPSLVALRGTWLDDLPWAYFFPGEERETHISAAVDGYLYLGPGGTLLNEPIPARDVLDRAYMAELERRARVRQGPSGTDPVRREVSNDTSIFFNQ